MVFRFWENLLDMLCKSRIEAKERILENMEQKLENAELAFQSLKDSYDALSVANDCLKESLQDCMNKLKAYEPSEEEVKWEQYWNNRYPKKVIIYAGRTFPKDPNMRYGIDVRYFFTISQPLYELVKANKLDIGTSDEKALKCLKWVHKNFKYVSDKTAYGSAEYWAFPCESLYTKIGDCDDGAILLANLMLHAGIPYWRIRLNAGDVKGGGHCYVTYCRETDNQFVVLDWCYWYNDKPVSERPLHKDEQDYYGIWFSWNQLYSFGQMDTMAGAIDILPVIFKRHKEVKRK